MKGELVWMRRWRVAHVDRGDGFTRCGRILDGAQPLLLIGEVKKCRLCQRETPRQKRNKASIGMYCQRCHAHQPLPEDACDHGAALRVFRDTHRDCPWKIENEVKR